MNHSASQSKTETTRAKIFGQQIMARLRWRGLRRMLGYLTALPTITLGRERACYRQWPSLSITNSMMKFSWHLWPSLTLGVSVSGREVRAHIAFILEHPLGSIVTNQLSAIPTIASIEAERWKLIVAEGARNIADGQKRGELGTDVPPELGAAMVLGAVRGAINQAVSEPATINIDQLNAEVWAFLGSGLQLST